MVSYQTWTSIVFEVVREKGGQFQNIDDGAQVVQLAADLWNVEKVDLQTATRNSAKTFARREIQVNR